jgi:hypothetical protein
MNLNYLNLCLYIFFLNINLRLDNIAKKKNKQKKNYYKN